MGRIAQSTIDRVREVDIIDVVSRYPEVKLKKKGSSYGGVCPFHNEKTGSFSVSGSKQIFKCFGCGEAGNGITFVMKMDRLGDWIDAVKVIAERHGVPVDYEEETERQKKERVDKVVLKQVMRLVGEKYRSLLLGKLEPVTKDNEVVGYNQFDNEAMQYLLGERGYSRDTILEWSLGWAPSEWRIVTGMLEGLNLRDAGVAAGMVKDKDGKFYDTYRGRIIFPVCDANGEVITLGGRVVPFIDYGESKPAKYINGAESLLYVKGKALYGLDKASSNISSHGFGILVEGYTDVISMHMAGANNTVAACGTALTPEHVKMMKRYSDTWVLMRDGDAAGVKALLRDVPMLLSAGIKVLVYVLEDGEDPDGLALDYYREAGRTAPVQEASLIEDREKEFRDLIETDALDGLDWLTGHFVSVAGNNIHKKNDAFKKICEVLCFVEDEFLRDAYIDAAAKTLGVNKKMLKDSVKEKVKVVSEKLSDSEEDEITLPDWADEDEVHKYGFVERRDAQHCGLYFVGDSMSLKQQTNFVLTPLFHIYSQTDNRRLFEVYNGRETMMVEIPSKAALSVEQFCAILYSEGTFLPMGTYSKLHHMKLLAKVSPAMPMAYELTALGWQPKEEFFAYSNMVFIPGKTPEEKGQLVPFDEYGVVKVGETYFYSPSNSKANKHVRSDDNIYENDLYLIYKESPIDFAEWCRLIVDTYDEHGWIMIPFVIGTLFRDIIMDTTPLPLPYPYGIVNSGKSQILESVSNFFFSGKDSLGQLYKPFNLNQGTIYAFFNRMERFINLPNVLNEFDENAIEDEFFRGIKSGYDGEGRERGQKDKNRAKTQKIRCSIIFGGQYLGTKDENSVLQRSLPMAVKAVPIDLRPEKQLRSYDRLKKLEHTGLSGIITEVLKYRMLFRKEFAEVFARVTKEMQQALKEDSVSVQPRILKNFCCMVTIVQIAEMNMTLPFTSAAYFQFAKDRIKDMTALVSSTSGASDFWSMVEYLLDRNKIEEGREFLIEMGATSITLVSDGKPLTKPFTPAKNLLYIRMSGVHKLYQQEYRTGTGKAALNEQTLLLYLREQPYYVGWMKAKKFKTGANSCYVFAYDDLNINLLKEYEADRVSVVITGEVTGAIQNTALPDMYKFYVKETVAAKAGLTTVSNQFLYHCFTEKPEAMADVRQGWKIQMKGLLKVEQHGRGETRTLDVTEYECVSMNELFMNNWAVVDEDVPF